LFGPDCPASSQLQRLCQPRINLIINCFCFEKITFAEIREFVANATIADIRVWKLAGKTPFMALMNHLYQY